MLLPCFFCKSQHLYTAVLPSTGSTKPFVHPAHPAIPMQAELTLLQDDAETKFLDAADSNFMEQAGQSPEQMQP